MQPLGLGIIGLHHQHPRWYYPLFAHLPEYKPLAIAERDKVFLDDQAGFYGLDTYTDYRKLLGRDDIDVVLVFLPHTEMPEAVAEAAEAGKHVIVEKPCAATVEGLELIAETQRKHPHLKISAPYCWRNHPASERLHTFIRDGVIGDIVAMEARLNAGGAHRYVRDKCPWVLKASEGGGPMWNLGVHWIDYLRWMTKKEIDSVTGAVSRIGGSPERDIEDNAQALLSFGNGAIGILDISYSLKDDYPGKRDIYLAFRGTLGSLSWAPAWEGTKDEILLVGDHESMGKEKCRRVAVESRDIPGYGGHMGWTWLRDFAGAVRENREPVVTVNDMLTAVKVADAFYRSVKSGKQESVDV